MILRTLTEIPNIVWACKTKIGHDIVYYYTLSVEKYNSLPENIKSQCETEEEKLL